ncbi:hypothetical protein A8H37_14760 [Burkholderia thailandensis]|nr:hypothetical protein A8H37_14760 [Burkholderia thailandensis]
MTAARVASRATGRTCSPVLSHACSRAFGRPRSRAPSTRGERAAAIAAIAAAAVQPSGHGGHFQPVVKQPFLRTAPTCPRPNPFRCRAAPIAISCRSRHAGWTTTSTGT